MNEEKKLYTVLLAEKGCPEYVRSVLVECDGTPEDAVTQAVLKYYKEATLNWTPSEKEEYNLCPDMFLIHFTAPGWQVMDKYCGSVHIPYYPVPKA